MMTLAARRGRWAIVVLAALGCRAPPSIPPEPPPSPPEVEDDDDAAAVSDGLTPDPAPAPPDGDTNPEVMGTFSDPESPPG